MPTKGERNVFLEIWLRSTLHNQMGNQGAKSGGTNCFAGKKACFFFISKIQPYFWQPSHPMHSSYRRRLRAMRLVGADRHYDF